ncbi:MAG TPA: hypothetical protein VGN54_03100 [Mycobacteriales bacterium]|nr:hypothetical protein [Mycobacteriales bacterium]
MLRYLAHPTQLLGVVVAVVLGLLGHNLAQAYAARALGDQGPLRQGYGTPNPQRHLEALGVVAALLAYHGWTFAAPVPIEARFRRQRSRATVALLCGPAFLLLLTFAAVALLRATSQGRVAEGALAAAITAAGLLIMSLLPIPPLTGGRVLFLYAPTSPGWQRARYQLTETQTGALIALAILLVPVVFQGLPDIVNQLAAPVLRAVGQVVGVPFA